MPDDEFKDVEEETDPKPRLGPDGEPLDDEDDEDALAEEEEGFDSDSI